QRWHAYRSSHFRDACQAAMESKSWERLEESASEWLRWDRRANEALLFLADAQVQQGDLAAAADTIEEVDDAYDGALQALATRGERLYTELNRPLDAVENWKRMLRINPRADVARQRLIFFYAL